MQIVHSEHGLTTRDAIFLPWCRYVVPESIGRAVEEALLAKHPEAHYILSSFNSYERRYSGQALTKGQSLLVYRHGAFGDTLMTTAVLKAIRARCPEAHIDLYCRPSGAEMWYGVAGVRAFPGYPPFDAARRYTHHLLYENMLENNSEDDQGCAVDDMLNFAGIDPASVSDKDKLPVVVEKEGDSNGLPFLPSRPYVIVQWSASNPNRTYPHTKAVVNLLQNLPMCRQGAYIIVVGDKADSPEWSYETSNVIDLRGRTPSFRNLIPLVRNASLVICPDSSVGHLAAAFPNVPVISLWGLFAPDDRVKYAKNHHALTAPGSCPHMPCRSHLFTLPKQKCKDAPGFNGRHCAALAAIEPERIIALARELLS